MYFFRLISKRGEQLFYTKLSRDGDKRGRALQNEVISQTQSASDIAFQLVFHGIPRKLYSFDVM